MNPKGGNPQKIIDGLDHVLAHCQAEPHLCVANLSIDNPGHSVNWKVRNKIEELVVAGITVVACAGNEYPNRDPPVISACKHTYGSSPKVISVGSSNRKDQTEGNYGPCITVHAPGDEIWSAGTENPNQIVKMGGCSMATPRKFHYCCIITQLVGCRSRSNELPFAFCCSR